MDRLTRLAVACAISFAAACQGPDTILLTVSGDHAAQQYDLFVRDDESGQIVFHSGFNPVSNPGEPPRNITEEPLKIALRLSRGGRFTLLLVGVDGQLDGAKPAVDAVQMFWADRLELTGTARIDARLLTVPPGDDRDRDLWPDAIDFPAHNPEAAQRYDDKPFLLDCNDKVDMPLNGSGQPVVFTAADINPFATETCNDGYDQNCNGNEDEACVDEDGDGDPRGKDCDDTDPARHNPTAADPFPDPPNCCGYSLGKLGTAEAKVNFLGQPICPMQRCGDGIDNACKGADTACRVDDDCDTYVSRAAGGNDCNDADPNINPGAIEVCGNDVDEDCDGVLNNGCVPCDLDGDGYQRSDAPNGCPDASDQHPGMVDCNDYDSGVYPGSTAMLGSSEGGGGGSAALLRLSALRGLCRRIYEPTGTVGTAKIAPAGAMAGDADCDGTPYESCPTVACDADGDGYPNNGAGCNPASLPVDCNDANPNIFPGAPDKCGNGVAENCQGDSACGSNDKDGDGYVMGVDCDDTKPNVYPWARELCDGIDNDCDGFIDEGNPDGAGDPMVTAGAVTACTDNNVGECGKTRGLCVCSVAAANSVLNPSDRMACPTELDNGPKPPKCYGAGQPKPEVCATHTLDEDCNGAFDDPTGVNLAEKGMTCGVTVGQCRAGTVAGCNSGQVNPFAAFGIPGVDPWFVCSMGDTINPSNEVCDGIDNDCNGSLPLNERDPDNDKYLGCSPCNGLPLAPGLMGCGDCVEAGAGAQNINPGATETCNNIDDDCNPGTADGAGQCGMGANPPNCCSLQSACRNLAMDFNNCTGCGIGCILDKADSCNNGCRCGNGPACTGQSYCNKSVSPAQCNPCNVNTRCGASCLDCTLSGNVCNTAGSACTECNNDGDCDAKYGAGVRFCNGGTCEQKRANGTACTCTGPSAEACNQCQSGKCTDGVCCNQGPAMCNGCQACNRSGSNGTCSNVQPTDINPDPHNVCNANLATCDLAICNGANSCKAANNTPCGSDSCTGNTLTQPRCMSGSCSMMMSTCANSLTCNGTGTACLTNCSDDNGCLSTHYCAPDPGPGGQCVLRKANGAACNLGAGSDCQQAGCRACTSNFCVDGVCCQSACSTADSCAAGSLTTHVCQAGSGNCQMTSTACGGGAYTCASGSTCNTNCSCGGAPPCDSGNCTSGYFCNGSSCEDKRSNGSGCTGDAQCETGNCEGGFCCATACAGQVCTGSTISGVTCSSGTCQPSGGMSCPGNYTCASATMCHTTCTAGMQSNCRAGFCCVAGNNCVANTAPTSCGASCTDCSAQASNKNCISGSCGCNRNEDCAGGEMCNMGTNRCM